jgi:type I restriction enzyme S subunit
MNNLTPDGRLDLTKRRRVPRETKKIDTYLVESGDVLFNGTNSPELVGKSAFIGRLDEPAVFSNHFVRLRADETRLDGRFLARWLQSQWERGLFRSRARQWVNQAAFGTDELLDLRVGLPPVEEQRRIAAILDAADELRAKRRESVALLDLLTASIFDEMFGRGRLSTVTVSQQKLDHPEGWPWEALTDVGRLATGHTPDREVPEYWDGDIPWISLTEIRQLDGKVANDTDLRVSQAGIDHSSSVILPAGTVCFSRTASIGFVTVMGRPMATSQDFVNWVCGDRLQPLYLMHALLRSREQLRALSTGSTHKTIYMRIAEQFRVLVPPLALQDDFVRRVHDLTRQSRRATDSGTRLGELFASIRHRAFRGEL